MERPTANGVVRRDPAALIERRPQVSHVGVPASASASLAQLPTDMGWALGDHQRSGERQEYCLLGTRAPPPPPPPPAVVGQAGRKSMVGTPPKGLNFYMNN